MEQVVVERVFDVPVTDEELRQMGERAGACSNNLRVRRLCTYLSRDRKRMICIYEAPDAEAARKASDATGAPYVRLWTATVFPGG